ncbi:MAG: site-2 protease family protein [Vallitalea sp.]|jgi:Zn-dependent protease|nr:site-2 protease family protein [Vallitalea sp.]
MEVLEILINLIIKFLCAVIVICVHEYPRMIVYKALVHPLYKREAKISFNPLRYMDPFGMICFVFLNVGWQKPFTFNTGRLRDKNKGLISISLIGILCNLLLMAILIPILINVYNVNDYLTNFLKYLIVYNLAIVIVNLLPVPPFDMVKIIQAINPQTYFKFIQYEKIIQAVFIFLLASNVITKIIVIVYRGIMSVAL